MALEADTSVDSSQPLLESGLIALFFFVGLGLFAIGVVLGRGTAGVAAHKPDSTRIGSGLPWRDDLSQLTAKYTRFDGSLYPQKANRYRGAPSKEIDSAWDRFTTNPWMVETAAVLNVSAQESARAMNDRAIETVVRLDQDSGGGYMGTLEVFHQLHCLNILRKWTYIEHYSAVDPFWAKENDHRREHTGMCASNIQVTHGANANSAAGLNHCIDMVRQALMCNADTGLILFHWVKGMPVPSPDFHTMHGDGDGDGGDGGDGDGYGGGDDDGGDGDGDGGGGGDGDSDGGGI
ncbi:hypothetical protein MY3296_006220 [Beauveria thailandica]